MSPARKHRKIGTSKQLETATDVEFSDLIQSVVVERLAAEKWIQGCTYVTPRVAEFHLTELGKAKVRKLAKYLRPFEAHCFFGEISKARWWDKLKLMIALRIYGNAFFRSPLLSAAEEAALTVLLALEARKLRESSPN